MTSSLSERIAHNRATEQQRALRHQQADEAIRNHYAANCEQAARTLAEFLEEQHLLISGQERSLEIVSSILLGQVPDPDPDPSLEETARAVVEEFEHALKAINQMPKSWAAGEVTHYDKANAKATREYLGDYLLALAEHMAFLGNPPPPVPHTFWDFRKQVAKRDPELLEEALLIANQIHAGDEGERAEEALASLFLKVLDQGPGNPWWQDRLRNVRLHLDRAARFRTDRRDASWAAGS